MGNYYDGKLSFALKEDTPKDVIHDLLLLSSECYSLSYFEVLQNEKWGKHKGYDYPNYRLQLKKYNGHDECYLFETDFCMKGYRVDGDCLGEDIYEFLKQYIDETYYDMSDGGYIGRIYDEDDTYNKTFYVDYTKFNKELEKRRHLCNSDCCYYREGVLCDKYIVCERAYCLGKMFR